MAEPKRIFVSHSSKDDPAALCFLEIIVQTINNAKDANGDPMFVALVDRDLDKAEFWRGILYNWMLLCDAAVILLDENSTRSTWVPREAMVFRWRQQVDPSFHVLPVLRGVGKEIFDDRVFAEMGLNDLTYADAADADGIIDALLRAAAPSCDVRLDELERQLSVTPRNPNRFARAAPLLDLSLHPFLAAFEPERAVAASLLGYGFREGPFRNDGPFNPCAQALRIFSEWIEKSQLRKIFEIVCTYWVDRAAAARLFGALNREGVIALRLHLTHDTWPERVVTDYVGQACSQGVPPVYDLKRIPAFTESAGLSDELTHTRERVRNLLWRSMLRETRSANDADKTRIDNALRNRRGNLFLWTVDSDQMKLEHLVQVQKEMAYLRIVYLYSDDSRRDVSGVYYVEPEMDSGIEAAASREIDAAVSFLPRVYEF